MRHGGQILVDQLKAHGVRRVFSVPGESFLAALDGLYDSGIDNVVCRHEGGAAMMAEAYGKMTGTPGVAFVTRGPGATNASSGIHVASQDSTPMVLFVGQIARDHTDRGAFQEVDYRQMFGGLAKWAAQVNQTERLPEYINRAFHLAQSGRPGPVVLALPEDMLSALCDVATLPPSAPARPGVAQADITAILDRLAPAKRPLVVIGGPGWTPQAGADLARFAQTHGLPVVCSFRRQDFMDNRHPNFVGDLPVGMNPALRKRLGDADTLLLLGTRFGDIATDGYQIVAPADPGKTIIHVHPSPDEPGTVLRSDLTVTARTGDVLAALARTNGGPGWHDLVADMRAEYEVWHEPLETPGDVKLEQVIRHLSDTLPDDAIITNGAGNFAAWVGRYFRFKQHGTQIAPTSGSMGYGLPAAVAASLEYPDRPVVCVAGDGDFQMTLNELSTGMQYGAKVVAIVVNNGRYGTIRAHQEREYPGRVSGTQMFNPDFAALARAYGGHGETVTRTEDFPAAFARARAAATMAVIELTLDPEALAPGMTLSAARAAGIGRKKP
ncbi:thiamine pyrophosphate-binding protein [Aliiroseovarius sp. PTFE2010]|uniref:thiamine pyrophosphate-binding protein n=1 Tax=Aliiroseovarius sp. PTFE2010 TaxID=3417190 RepID=UPI003CEB3FD2